MWTLISGGYNGGRIDKRLSAKLNAFGRENVALCCRSKCWTSNHLKIFPNRGSASSRNLTLPDLNIILFRSRTFHQRHLPASSWSRRVHKLCFLRIFAGISCLGFELRPKKQILLFTSKNKSYFSSPVAIQRTNLNSLMAWDRFSDFL